MNCLKCGRFVGSVTAHYFGDAGDETITRVTGECSRCGEVDLTDSDQWGYETFFGWGDE